MPISSQNTPSLNASSTNTAWFFLLTINPASGGTPINLVNNNEMVTSNGVDYQPYPFSLTLPLDTGDKIPQITLTIDNVDQLLTNAVRELELAPSIRVQLITSAFPDLVEKDLDFLKLRNVSYDAMSITGTLEVASVWARKFPSEIIDPVHYPSLFY
jgi:Domain of unknown function (DUF1833)